MPAQIDGLEDKLLSLVLDVQHLFILIGILALIYLSKKITPIGNFLFSDKWQWLIAPINVAFSAVGIFLLKMTAMTTMGAKIVMALAIAAVATALWEWVFKYIEQWIQSKFSKALPPPVAPPPAP